ncbi:MAG: hypothetical protein ABIH87_01265 [bacterium]
MPKNLAKEDVNTGKLIYKWQVREYEKPGSDRRWYTMMGLAGALLLIFGLFTGNYLFILVIVLFAIILFLHSMQDPMEVDFAITETGIVLGNKFYRYSELENFWIIYNPPEVKNLYFGMRSVIKHRLQIPLLDNDPRAIHDYLAQYMVEEFENEDEPFSDRLARLFKL